VKSRIIVALIGVPVVLACLLLDVADGALFAALVCAAFTLAVLEFYGMMRPYGPFVPAGMVAVALAPVFAWRAGEPGIMGAMLVVLPLTMVFAQLSVPRREPAVSMMATLAGVLYVAPAAGLAIVIHTSTGRGPYFVLMILAAIWVNDTSAYFAGRAFGRHKLAPRLSPKKSIEGFVAGVAAGTFVTWFGNGMFESPPLTGAEALMLGITLGVATPFGDLFESMVKRAAGVKDSGTLLGDHGGMLDRIDALLTTVPVAYLALFLFGEL